jgi:hypothetical protein
LTIGAEACSFRCDLLQPDRVEDINLLAANFNQMPGFKVV